MRKEEEEMRLNDPTDPKPEMYLVVPSCCRAGSVGCRRMHGVGAGPWWDPLRIRQKWDMLAELWAQ